MSESIKRLANSFYQNNCKPRAQRLREDVHHAFVDHPIETGETYLQHLWFTCKLALRFLLVGAIIITHGFFPFLFTRTASAQVEKIYLIMKSRIPKARREIIDDYEI